MPCTGKQSCTRDPLLRNIHPPFSLPLPPPPRSWFDLDLSTKPYRSLRYHQYAIRGTAFHRSYPLFASASDDATVHIFHGMVYSDLMTNPLIVPGVQKRGRAAEMHGLAGAAWLLDVMGRLQGLFSAPSLGSLVFLASLPHPPLPPLPHPLLQSRFCGATRWWTSRAAWTWRSTPPSPGPSPPAPMRPSTCT